MCAIRHSYVCGASGSESGPCEAADEGLSGEESTANSILSSCMQ